MPDRIYGLGCNVKGSSGMGGRAIVAAQSFEFVSLANSAGNRYVLWKAVAGNRGSFSRFHCEGGGVAYSDRLELVYLTPVNLGAELFESQSITQ